MQERGNRKGKPTTNVAADRPRPAGKETETPLPFGGRWGLPITIAAPDETTGIRMEYEHVEQVLGPRDDAWELVRQELHSENGRYYDLLHVRLKSGERRSFLFDISDWFGRWNPMMMLLTGMLAARLTKMARNAGEQPDENADGERRPPTT